MVRDWRLEYRLYLHLWLHNLVIFFFFLLTVCFSGLLLYLSYWGVVFAQAVPFWMWGLFFLVLGLSDMAFLLSQKREHVPDHKLRSITVDLLRYIGLFYLFLFLNIFLVSCKFVFMGLKQRRYATFILELLFLRKEPEVMERLMEAVLRLDRQIEHTLDPENLKRIAKESSEREFKERVLPVVMRAHRESRKILRAIRCLQKLSFLKMEVAATSREVLLSLSQRGRDFVLRNRKGGGEGIE